MKNMMTNTRVMVVPTAINAPPTSVDLTMTQMVLRLPGWVIHLGPRNNPNMPTNTIPKHKSYCQYKVQFIPGNFSRIYTEIDPVKPTIRSLPETCIENIFYLVSLDILAQFGCFQCKFKQKTQ